LQEAPQDGGRETLDHLLSRAMQEKVVSGESTEARPGSAMHKLSIFLSMNSVLKAKLYVMPLF
jgi:hypothetical protein